MEALQAQIEQLQANLTAQQEANQALQQQLQQQQNPFVPPVPLPPQPEQPGVYRVAAKLPPFWPDSPTVWFAQVEAQFATAHIVNDQTKYDYVVGQLDSKYASVVRDILTHPPPENKYNHLKNELIRRRPS